MSSENQVLEKRTNPRVPIKIPVKYRLVDETGEFSSMEEPKTAVENAHTLDLSLEGMYLSLDQPLKAGNIIKSDVFLLEPESSVTIYAEVVWADGEGAGIHFLLMANEERESLGTFLEKTFSSGVRTA